MTAAAMWRAGLRRLVRDYRAAGMTWGEVCEVFARTLADDVAGRELHGRAAVDRELVRMYRVVRRLERAERLS